MIKQCTHCNIYRIMFADFVVLHFRLKVKRMQSAWTHYVLLVCAAARIGLKKFPEYSFFI
jgi:hypothetical protein